MAEYNIYKNPSGSTVAVKKGWSWPAFLFTWIWALLKGLHKPAIIIIIFLIGAFILSQPNEISTVFTIILTVASLWLGI
jgi:hypothetical protein